MLQQNGTSAIMEPEEPEFICEYFKKEAEDTLRCSESQEINELNWFVKPLK